jgi:hypothetical protein
MDGDDYIGADPGIEVGGTAHGKIPKLSPICPECGKTMVLGGFWHADPDYPQFTCEVDHPRIISILSPEDPPMLDENDEEIPVPYHLQEKALPLARCTHCNRISRAADEIEKPCQMTQPDGHKCQGTMARCEAMQELQRAERPRRLARRSTLAIGDELIASLDEKFHTVSMLDTQEDKVPGNLVIASCDPDETRKIWLALLRGGWAGAVERATDGYPDDSEADDALFAGRNLLWD